MPLLHPKKQARAAAGTGKNPAGRYTGGAEKKTPPRPVCGARVRNEKGAPTLCDGEPLRRRVWLHLPQGQNVHVCDAVICHKCRRAFLDRNGHPLALGPYVPRADIKYFDLPRTLWKGDWAWRQKLAWAVLKLLENNPGRWDFDLDEALAGVSGVPVPCDDYKDWQVWRAE